MQFTELQYHICSWWRATNLTMCFYFNLPIFGNIYEDIQALNQNSASYNHFNLTFCLKCNKFNQNLSRGYLGKAFLCFTCIWIDGIGVGPKLKIPPLRIGDFLLSNEISIIYSADFLLIRVITYLLCCSEW